MYLKFRIDLKNQQFKLINPEDIENSKRELNNWYRLYPEKFNNKTNGVTQRRWLLKANPELADFITELLDSDNWIINLEELKKLETIYKLKNNKLYFSIYILEKNLNHTKYIDNLNINDFSILLYKYIDDTYKVFIKNKKFDIEIENEKMRITIFNLNNYINFSIWLKEHSIKNRMFF